LAQSDAQPGNDHVVVLGYGLWQRYFAADRAMVGRTIRLNGELEDFIAPRLAWRRQSGKSLA
jgi:hypothetical protein